MMSKGARPLVLALPKGRIADEAAALLGRAGHDISAVLGGSRKLIHDCGSLRVLVLRSSDVPTYVSHGAADVGVAGSDVLDEHACDLYEPQVLRASMGSFFALPAVRLPSHHDLTAWLERLRSEPEGLSIVGTSANAEQEVGSEAFAGRCLLLFGNETTGLSAAYRQLCDRVVKIPMGGSASSLNISCAASIVLYEAFRRR